MWFKLLLLFSCCLGAVWANPYVEQSGRDIKALTPEEVKNYLEAKGMGLAKAAELNGYPGPSHVLELAEALELSEAQRVATQALFEKMRSNASAAGAQLIEDERVLDRLFATGDINETQLRLALAKIARLQADIRAIHLSAHLEQKRLLNAPQVEAYNRLRGYTANKTDSRHHAH